MRIVFVVTHLLGTGHLARTLVLADAFARAQHDVHVISGGFPVPHLHTGSVKLHQLPPLRSDGVDFTRMIDDTGQIATPDALARRAERLADLFRQLAPDALVTELFPFGRRVLKAEFETLLDAVPKNTPVFASIRDILAPPSKQSKADYAQRMIDRHYEAVLVHGDAQLTPLDLSWPVDPLLRKKLVYTGFVAPQAPVVASQHQDALTQGAEIVVSAGGGAVGDAIFETAILAANESGYEWRMFVGGDAARVARFADKAPQNMQVTGLSPRFRDYLAGARASVGMAGYNTCIDILQTGTPALLVPFDAGNEVEQTLRARAFENLPGIARLATQDLTARHLLEKLENLMRPQPDRPEINMDGAGTTVEIVENRVGGATGDL